jgi:2-isopropylmalate synthase
MPVIAIDAWMTLFIVAHKFLQEPYHVMNSQPLTHDISEIGVVRYPNLDPRVRIFDTTLRDGEQSAGAALHHYEKLQIAKQLEKLKVDIIEAGFPASSEADFNSVREIASVIEGSVVAGLARCKESDIQATWDAIKVARSPRIHTFIGTSDIHIQAKFNKTREEILNMAVAHVRFAKRLCDDIEFSAEDAGRTDPEFLMAILEAVIEAGATTVNIPDTVGYTLPNEFGNLIYQIRQRVPNIDKAIISTHCHNDLGLAVANSLQGVMNGARQVECTINGIGERAGNAALEEIVMALHVRRDVMEGIHTTINPIYFYETSKMVSEMTSISVQPNKAIVGRNAFAHESGIHQDGYLKGRNTYEILEPETVGVNGTDLPLGPRSGRAALRMRMKALGYELNTEELAQAFPLFKEMADAKKRLDDADLHTLYAKLNASLKACL